MSTQQLFYRSVIPVSGERHRAWSVKTGDNYAFAAEVNSVPLTAVEFAQAAAEYPIVFTGNEQAVFPAVVLGARLNENLQVDGSGKWRGRYIPAFIRRYPFAFSQDEEGKTFTLNIDERFEGCNQAGRGERLFTRAYCDRLVEHELLQPMQAQFTLLGGQQRALTGFMAVDRQKLRALPAEVLAEMVAKDELECTYLHLHSIRHFQDMLARMPAEEMAAR